MPIIESEVDKELVTVYDHFEFGVFHKLHALYSNVVEELIISSKPVEMGAVWSRSQIKAMIQPGSICYCIRGFHFKRGEVYNKEESRLVYVKSKRIMIRMYANAKHMFGNSALYDSFCGSRFIANLFLVKDIVVEGKDLVVVSTPIAMGAGFGPMGYKTPHEANLAYGWANGNRIPYKEKDDEWDDE